jgi:hypothetical protein
MHQSQPILVAVSAGELWDKVTILRIKAERITDDAKRKNVLAELTSLDAAITHLMVPTEKVNALVDRLRGVNESLWTVEDDIRRCENNRDFGPEFIALARSVYRLNDERGRIKRQINDFFGSAIVEEKQYPDYV